MEPSFSSLHTHTRFCDGKDDVETMCRTAVAKKLVSIGFSSHAPLEKAGISTNWNMHRERLGDYIAEVRAARGRWEEKIMVYLGLELDYIKGLRSALDSDITGNNFDYLISSVHYLAPPRGAPFTIDGPVAEVERGVQEGFGGDGEAMVNAYWDAIAEMIALGGFDIVGHIDLVKKSNAIGKWFDITSGNYMRRVNEIVRAISDAGLVVEVNTGGINRGYFDETYPSPEILHLLRQYDIPVMISADAHRSDDLDGNYQKALQTLRNAGYTHHVLFEGKNGGKSVWRRQAIDQ